MKTIQCENIWIRLLLWLIISVTVVLVFASSTSPFYVTNGGDSALYRSVGYMWQQGSLPYVDIFDNKGPYLYLIERLGALLSGQAVWGIVLLQVLNLAIVAELCYRIARIFTAKAAMAAGATAMAFVYLIITFQGGNLTEDWSLLFMLLPLYLALRRIKEISKPEPPLYAFIYGLCFGVLSFIRINNAYVIVGVVVGIGALLIMRRRFRELGMDALWFVVGMVAGMAPMLIYFAAKGALGEMFYCVFVYNLKYSEVWPTLQKISYTRNLWLLLPSLIASYVIMVYDRKNRTNYRYVVFASAAVFFLAFFRSTGFIHYYLLAMPLMLTMFAAALAMSSWQAFLVALVAYVPFYQEAKAVFENVKSGFDIDAGDRAYQHIGSVIPEADRDDVFLYNLTLAHNAAVTYGNLKPSCRFTYLNESVMAVDERYRKEMEEYMTVQRPKWIFCAGQPSNPVFIKMLEDYTVYGSYISMYVLLRKDMVVEIR